MIYMGETSIAKVKTFDMNLNFHIGELLVKLWKLAFMKSAEFLCGEVFLPFYIKADIY